MRRRRALAALLAATVCFAVSAGCTGYRVKKIDDSLERTRDIPAVTAKPKAAALPVAAPALQPQPAKGSEVLLYTTQQGDTLRGVARRELGWALLWRHLMEWNKRPESPTDTLPENITIEVPVQFRILAQGARFMESKAIPPVVQPLPGPPPVPRIEGTPPGEVFQVGEKLTYAVKWFFITAGHASLSVESLGQFRERRCYKFLARATSKLIFFFKVNDWIESYSTSNALLPVQYEKHLREGRYKNDVIATFDPENGTATWGGKETPLGEGCRDLLGAFYYLRTMPLPDPGEETTVCVNTNGKNYPMTVNVLRREVVKVRAGTFRTILIKPRLKFEGLFRQRGDLLVWLTDDRRRLPVLVRGKVHLLGSVHIVLIKQEQP